MVNEQNELLIKENQAATGTYVTAKASTKAELDRMQHWFEENFLGSSEPPFSLACSGKKLVLEDKAVSKLVKQRMLDAARVEYTITYEAGAGLYLECIAVLYRKYAVCEWKLNLRNISDCDTNVVSDFFAIDTALFKDESTMLVLKHFNGDNCVRTGYRPLEHIFYDECKITFCNYGGRPTNMEFPYYKLNTGNSGYFFVLSWQGQWETSFSPSQEGLRIKGRQKNLSCRLHPNESISSPMSLLYFYDGCDDDRSINLWRHWFMEYNMPRLNGKLIPPFYINYPGKIFYEMVNANEKKLFEYIDKYADHGIKFDYLWLDAGWYEMHGNGQWHNTGTWKADRKRFPNGIRAITDYAMSRVGAKSMLWFEPERVNPDTEIYEEHPEWCLSCRKYEELYKKDPEAIRAGSRLLNLGNEAALDFIVERINSIIKSENISIYREDFNMEPYDCWVENDETGRSGILENHYCSGYLKFYDRLLADNPDIFIDNCASGGRRNDLESMRRSIPLHKTDYDPGDITAKHAFHHSLLQWFPFFGSFNMPGDQSDIYYQRSSLLLAFSGCENVFSEGFDFELLDRWMQEWRENAYCMYGDYYPVTPYSLDDKSWIGWQFDIPENDDLQALKGEGPYNRTGEGMLQLFMRKDSPYKTAKIKLKNLQPYGNYIVKDYNKVSEADYTGEYLMNEGLEVRMTHSPDSALYHYSLKK